jgi:hypothetical protein
VKKLTPKKLTPKKLRINRETIRSLATHELTQVVGGEETVTTDSGRTVCPAQAVVDSAAAPCPKLGG